MHCFNIAGNIPIPATQTYFRLALARFGVMRIISHSKIKKMECQGECKRQDECAGEIKEVIVYGTFCPTGLKFNYCQTAREEDERRGFTVEIVDENGLTSSDYYSGVTHPNG